jgi:hypothetical protein
MSNWSGRVVVDTHVLPNGDHHVIGTGSAVTVTEYLTATAQAMIEKVSRL